MSNSIYYWKSEPDSLMHHGVKGMKWGQRKQLRRERALRNKQLKSDIKGQFKKYKTTRTLSGDILGGIASSVGGVAGGLSGAALGAALRNVPYGRAISSAATGIGGAILGGVIGHKVGSAVDRRVAVNKQYKKEKRHT